MYKLRADESTYRDPRKRIRPLLFLAQNSSETKQPFETVLHGIVHDQREFATIYSILVKFIIPVRRDMSSSLKIPSLLR